MNKFISDENCAAIADALADNSVHVQLAVVVGLRRFLSTPDGEKCLRDAYDGMFCKLKWFTGFIRVFFPYYRVRQTADDALRYAEACLTECDPCQHGSVIGSCDVHEED